MSTIDFIPERHHKGGAITYRARLDGHPTEYALKCTWRDPSYPDGHGWRPEQSRFRILGPDRRDSPDQVYQWPTCARSLRRHLNVRKAEACHPFEGPQVVHDVHQR